MEQKFEQIQRLLAENIRRQRGQMGLSQERLALEAGVDRTYVSQLERGICNPSLLVLHKIAVCLDSDLLSLLSPMGDVSSPQEVQ